MKEDHWVVWMQHWSFFSFNVGHCSWTLYMYYTAQVEVAQE